MHIRTFLTLGSGEAVSRVIAFGSYVYLAATLGAEGYGIIAFAAGITLYLSKVADFAIEAVGASEVARDRSRIPVVGGVMISARLMVAAVLIVVCTTFVQLTVAEPDRTVLTWYFLTLLPVAASTKWIHLGLESTKVVGAWRVGGETIFLVLVVSLVGGVEDLWIVPLAMLAGEGLASMGLYIRLWLDGHRFGLRWDPRTALPMFKRAFPIMLQILMGLLLYNMDLLFLRGFHGAESVGYYAVAYICISFLANMGVVYAMSLLPAITRQGIGTSEERELYHTAMTEVVAVTAPVAVGGTFVAHGIIMAGFGEGYLASVTALQLLVWVIPVAVFRNVPWAALIVRGDRGMLFKATAAAVVANAIFNLLLVPTYGLIGAALATLFAEPIAMGLMLYYARREGLPLVSLRRLIRPLAAAAMMGIALYLLGDVRLLVQLAVGGVVYVTALAVMGSLRVRGWVPVLNL